MPMSRHVFFSPRPQPIPRWIEAFPGARVVCGADSTHVDAAMLSDASVVWLHVAEEDGAEWVRRVREHAGGTPVVVLSNVPEDDQGLAVLAAGAVGYSSALTEPVVLQQVASVVENGGLWVGVRLMRRLMQSLATRSPSPPHASLDRLSEREREVAEAASRGSTNKEIARAMGITERTVKAHLSASFDKLGVRDRLQLALFIKGVEDSTVSPQQILA